MQIGNISHSEINHQINPNNLILALNGVSVYFDNSVKIKPYNYIHILEIIWLITISLKQNGEVVMDYALSTSIEIISVNNYEKDLKFVKTLIGDSCTEFMEQIEKIEGSMPLIQPRFEEIAIRVLELMTDISLY